MKASFIRDFANSCRFKVCSLLTGLCLVMAFTCSTVHAFESDENNQAVLEHGLLVTKNIAYASYDKGEVHLDLYQPAGKDVYPGVVLVHGGGWSGGSRHAPGYIKTAIELAQRGYVVANLDYRLAGEAAFPAAVIDVASAVRWLRANASKYKVNPDKIVGIGGSAGGHLLAMVATNDHSKKFVDPNHYPQISQQLQASIILGSGVDQVDIVHEFGNNENQILFFGGKYQQVPETYREGSPITHVSPNMRPIYMIDGSLDLPGWRYKKFRKRLHQAGVTHQFDIVEGAKHGEWIGDKFRAQYIDLYEQFFKKYL
ncbi:alpha/beta hydrolase fold domain-containing protein [Agaribacter flavus]|uniref:Alpha/beta hydrolase fold domain-containing protein n=1 Tax=Agaribacter flavus TaxID=1902781 RepID=A0ABV7FT89_9ALTE